MNQRRIYGALAIAAGTVSMLIPMETQAAVGYDMRERVIELSGITDTYGTGVTVSRGEFAKMLVLASDYRSQQHLLPAAYPYFQMRRKTVSMVPDIRIAAKEGWMSGYLGGLFKPDEAITVEDAQRAILSMLGYTNEDFTGDQVNARSAKFQFLELSEGIDREASEVLNKKDCINLFYNLLRTKPKGSNTIYGSILGCELTEDGAIHLFNMVDSSLKGPKLVRRSQKLSSVIPFDTSEASWFLNGEVAYEETIKSALANDGYGVVYWNSDTKTVWYYSADSDDEDTGRVVVQGEVTHIYYNASDVMIPSAILLDNDDEDDPQAEYTLTTSELQYAFSMYGTVKVGDNVVLICEKTTNADGEPTYRVVDFLER